MGIRAGIRATATGTEKVGEWQQLPSPEQMRGYIEHFPEFAKTINEEFKRNGEHVREMEKAALGAQLKLRQLSLWTNLAIFLIVFGCATVIAISGKPIVGGSVSGLYILLWFAAQLYEKIRSK